MDILISLAIVLGINIVLFIPAYFFRTDTLTDFSYTLSFAIAALALFFLGEGGVAQTLALLMVILWALRLGGYLVIRIRKIKKDSRFDGIREDFFRFFKFFFFQGVTVFVILLPTTLLLSASPESLTTLSYVGLAVFAFGLIFEAVGDYQKYTFINKTGGGQFIQSGLWKYSRHPNYFGEITLWVGLFLFALPVLSGWYVLVGLLSPLFIAVIIIFVTGLPILEKKADERWGTDPAYQAYRARTAKLIPFIW